MSGPRSAASFALARLERALLRRRFTGLDLRLRLELLAFGTLAAGFFGWRVRVPLDGLTRHRGPLAAAAALAIGAAIVCLAGALLAAARHRGALHERSGPPWLAWPLPPAQVVAHLERVSALWALWGLVPAAGLLVAGIGLVPPALHALIAVALLALLLPSGRLGAAITSRRLARGRAIGTLLSTRAAPPRSRRHAPARWSRAPAWLALWRKDLALSRRPGPVRGRLAAALVLGLGSALAWRLPADPRLVAFVAFAGALLASAAIAEWIVALCGSDPFPVLRTLPVGVGAVWGARMASALAGALLLAGAHAALRATVAHAPWTPAAGLQIATTATAALLVGALGANYGVTLFPHADQAHRVLSLTLGLSIAASLMIPLMGWVTLATGLIHSARRLPRWATLEER